MLRHVRLELARCHDFPGGSSDHGYEMFLPLTAGGMLDRDAWHAHREAAVFRRFWGATEARGRLAHDRRGWLLAFERHGEGTETLFRGDTHCFLPGEYVSITERDGITRTFRVAALD